MSLMSPGSQRLAGRDRHPDRPSILFEGSPAETPALSRRGDEDLRGHALEVRLEVVGESAAVCRTSRMLRIAIACAPGPVASSAACNKLR